MKKRISFFLAVVMALTFAACSSGGTTSEEGTTTEETTTEATTEEGSEAASETSTAKSPDNDMVVAMQADITNLDPHVSSNGVSNTVTGTMYESLVTFDEDANIIPMLAKEWTMSEDGLTYTFILNEGITFSDGEPFNAEAVIANWERGKADQSLRVYSQTKAWVSAVADSEYQLTITLEEPNNTFLNKLTQVRIVSPKAIEERLKLRNPIYQETAAYGHMGREPQVITKKFSSRYEGDKTVEVELFTWEKLDYVDKIKAAFGL